MRSVPISNRIRRWVAAIFFIGMIAATPATSFSQFKLDVDEEVKVLFLSTWYDGVVLSKAKRKQYEIEFEWSNDVRVDLFTRSNIRKLYEFEALDYGRNWESTSGEFKIVAALKGWADESAILIKPDLTEITVPIEKLSSRDSNYVKKFIKNRERAIARGDIPATVPELPELETFDSGFSSNSIFSDSPLKLHPLGAIPSYLTEFTQAGVGFRLTRQRQELVAAIPVGGPEQYVLMAAREDPFGARNAKFQSQLYWVSLKQKKMTASVAITPGDYVVDYDPRHKLLLTFNEEEFASGDEPDHFTLWKLGVGASNAEPLIRFQTTKERIEDAPFARIVNDRIIIAKTERHTYEALDIVDKKTIYSLKTGSFYDAPVVLSPNRKNLIVPEDGNVLVIDAVTGSVKLNVRVNDRHVAAANVNSAGTRLAALTERNIYVWDLESGNKKPTIYPAPLMGSPFDSRIEWIGDDQILGDSPVGRILYSLRLKLPIWTYRMQLGDWQTNEDPLLNRVVDGVLFYVAQPQFFDNTVAIGAVNLPGPGVEEITDQIDRPSLMILKPGVHVGITLGKVSSPDKIKGWLTKKIEENGWVLDETADIQIHAEMGIGESQTVEYYDSGDRRKTTKVTFRPHYSRLIIKRGDLIVWQTGTSTGAPAFLSAGFTSVQSRLDRFQTPQLDFFDRVTFDVNVLDPQYSRGFGVSVLGSRGIEVVSTSPPGRADDPEEEARTVEQKREKALEEFRKLFGNQSANGNR